MAIMAMDMRNKRTFLVVALFFSPVASFAGDWEIKPTATLKETYSNNVTLDATNKESSLITQTGVDLAAEYTAQHADFTLASSSSYNLYSHDSSLNNDYHDLTASGSLQLWPNGITLTGSAAITNQARNLSNNALADLITSDTVQVETYQAGLAYQVSNRDFLLNASTGIQTSTSEDNIGERHGYFSNLTSKNGSAARLVFWDVNHSNSDYENNNQDAKQRSTEIKVGLLTSYKFNPFIRYYDESNSGSVSQSQSFESNSYGIGFRWLAQPRLYIDFSYNEPIDDEATNLDGEQQDAYGNIFIDWQPSRRTHISVSHGQRFYGDSYGLNISHGSKRLTNTISYSEQVQTFTRELPAEILLGLFYCKTGETINAENCSANSSDTIDNSNYTLVPITQSIVFENNNYTLSKNLSWQSTLALTRTTVSISLSRDLREALTSNTFFNAGKEDLLQTAQLNISRKTSINTKLTTDFSYRTNSYDLDTESERSDIYRTYNVTFEQQFNTQLRYNLGIQHTNRSSSNAIYNYHESRIFLHLFKDF